MDQLIKFMDRSMPNEDVDNRPIGKQNLLFRRTTNRYAKKGTISSNQGYISVARNTKTGQFAKRTV
jgi:hypothetical protein